MSLTQSPKKMPESRHAIDDSLVHDITTHQIETVSYQELTEALNLFQGLMVTEHDIPDFFETVDRPEHCHTVTDEAVLVLVTPVTWWELQTHADWDNTVDRAVVEAHRQQFHRIVESPETHYTTHQLETLHPVVCYLPDVD